MVSSSYLAQMTRPSKSSKPLTVNSSSLFHRPIKTGLNRANSLLTLVLLHLDQMTAQWSYGTLTLANKFTPSRTTRPESIQLNSILMEHVFPAEVRTNPSRSGISEARGWSNTMMHIAPTLTRSISTQMEDTCSQVVQIQPLRFGILDKAIFYIRFMVTRALPPQRTSRLVVTTSQLVVQTLLSWFGRVISMRTNKSSSKISVPKLEIIINRWEECLLSIRRDHLLQRELQPQKLVRKQPSEWILLPNLKHLSRVELEMLQSNNQWPWYKMME